jgi:hypothetical protein
MSATKLATAPALEELDSLAKLRKQYGCGPVDLTGTDDALYERHLCFDNVIQPKSVAPRDRFEAFARSAWRSTEEMLSDSAFRSLSELTSISNRQFIQIAQPITCLTATAT